MPSHSKIGLMDGKQNEVVGFLALSYSKNQRNLGQLKLLLPSSAFTQCAESMAPGNSLFRNVDPSNVKFENMQFYFALLLALFQMNPQGI